MQNEKCTPRDATVDRMGPASTDTNDGFYLFLSRDYVFYSGLAILLKALNQRFAICFVIDNMECQLVELAFSYVSFKEAER